MVECDRWDALSPFSDPLKKLRRNGLIHSGKWLNLGLFELNLNIL
jgi:hypothetical protein